MLTTGQVLTIIDRAKDRWYREMPSYSLSQEEIAAQEAVELYGKILFQELEKEI